MDSIGTLIFVVVLAAVFFIVPRFLDKPRIREYIVERGGQVIDISWEPFGAGWFGEKDSRIYRVTYINRAGETIEGFCKTSMFSGIYFSEEGTTSGSRVKHDSRDTFYNEQPTQISGEKRQDASGLDPQALFEENLRLRGEIQELKNELERLKFD